jgi:general secretion pathway protein I
MSASSSRRQRGFSLLELMVAFVVMAFSLGMLYQASGGTVRSLGDTEQHLRASMLAQSVLNSRDNVPEAGWEESGQSAGLTWRVSSASFATEVASANAPPLTEVRVVVAWTDRRGPRQIELTTLLPQAKPAPGEVR